MFSLIPVESALHRISLYSSACIFNRAYLKSQMKYIPSALNNSAPAILPMHDLQALGFNIVLLQNQTKYIPPASINPTSVSYCSCTPSLLKRVVQAHRFQGALLQKEIEYIPSTSINPTSASFCSFIPSSPKYVLQAPSSLVTFSASTEPCSRLLAVLPSCLEVRRFLHHSSLSCTRASTPLMKFSKSLIDRSLVPELLEKDLIESAIKGWGPGGQAVNKTNNAVFLKHVPTGLFVKVHKHRMRHKNALEARVLLLDKLDDLLNGPMSVSAQKARLLEKRSVKSEGKARKMRDLKAQWKQALGEPDTNAGQDNLRDKGDDLRDEIAGYDGLRDESAGYDGLRDGSAEYDGLKDESAGYDGIRDGSAGYDGQRDESAGYNGPRDESAGCDGLRDESGSGCGLRHKRARSLRVDSGDGSAKSEIGNQEHGNDLNKTA